MSVDMARPSKHSATEAFSISSEGDCKDPANAELESFIKTLVGRPEFMRFVSRLARASARADAKNLIEAVAVAKNPDVPPRARPKRRRKSNA